jgi:hypothetical protein
LNKERKRLEELTDKDGNFKSKYPGEPGKYTLGYLEELCEWLYVHDVLSNEEKVVQIMAIEDLIEKALKEGNISSFPINYIRTWSTKLKNKMK